MLLQLVFLTPQHWNLLVEGVEGQPGRHRLLAVLLNPHSALLSLKICTRFILHSELSTMHLDT